MSEHRELTERELERLECAAMIEGLLVRMARHCSSTTFERKDPMVAVISCLDMIKNNNEPTLLGEGSVVIRPDQETVNKIINKVLERNGIVCHPLSTNQG